jgi:transcriptional regulator with XRE-family HTH domain
MPASAPPLGPAASAQLQALGERLRSRRKSLGVTAVEAAEAAGISRPTLHRIEAGTASVTAGAWAALAAALGLALEAPDSTAGAAGAAEGTIPIRIRLADYPQLQRLAWQLDERAVLSPAEALGMYERNERHLQPERMSQEERSLLENLRTALRAEHRRV